MRFAVRTEIGYVEGRVGGAEACAMRTMLHIGISYVSIESICCAWSFSIDTDWIIGGQFRVTVAV